MLRLGSMLAFSRSLTHSRWYSHSLRSGSHAQMNHSHAPLAPSTLLLSPPVLHSSLALQHVAFFSTSPRDPYQDSASPPTFSSLITNKKLISALHSVFITRPTDVQETAMPTILQGKNTLFVAQTGTGKTLTYILPLMEMLVKDEHRDAVASLTSGQTSMPLLTRPGCPRAVIVVPNRELTEQVLAAAKFLSHSAKLRTAAVTGGAKGTKQEDKSFLKSPIDLLIGTPGRLRWLRDNKFLSFADCKYMVLDEVDTLFDGFSGFEEDLNPILQSVLRKTPTSSAPSPSSSRFSSSSSQPGFRKNPAQLICVAATVQPSIQELISTVIPNLQVLRCKRYHCNPASINHEWILVGVQDKQELCLVTLQGLLNQQSAHVVQHQNTSHHANSLLNSYLPISLVEEHKQEQLQQDVQRGQQKASGGLKKGRKRENLQSIMVFCNSVASCRSLEHFLSEKGLSCSHYHGSMPAALRDRHFHEFKTGRRPIMVCTDIAARGLDLHDVSHVLNYDFPLNATDFLHRIGRTGRQGRKGSCVHFLTKRDRILGDSLRKAIKAGAPLTASTGSKKDMLPSTASPAQERRTFLDKTRANRAGKSRHGTLKGKQLGPKEGTVTLLENLRKRTGVEIARFKALAGRKAEGLVAARARDLSEKKAKRRNLMKQWSEYKDTVRHENRQTRATSPANAAPKKPVPSKYW